VQRRQKKNTKEYGNAKSLIRCFQPTVWAITSSSAMAESPRDEFFISISQLLRLLNELSIGRL